MKDLRDAKYKDKNILLASPDADLILLSMLALVFNGVKIDIYRESILSPSNFEFKWNYITPPPSFAMKSRKSKSRPSSDQGRQTTWAS